MDLSLWRRLGGALLLLAAACAGPPDLVLTGGVVHTLLDGGGGVAEAVAVRDGRVVAVGNARDVAALIGPATRLVELDGRPVYPGFIDAHLHLTGLGLHLSRLDVVGTRSYDEVVAAAAAHARELPEGAWVLGRGWDQNDWADTAFPHHAVLSRALPDRPVAITRIDGHALLANEAAMRAAGITDATRSPPGGRIERDADGHPTGVFVDTAMTLVRAAIPEPDEAALERAVGAAIEHLHAHGITAIHDAGVSARELDVFVSLAERGDFALRNAVMVVADAHERRGDGRDAERRAAWLTPTHDVTGDGLISKRAIKAVADGALGSRGAALLEPYSDDATHAGLEILSRAELEALAVEALERGMQLAVHAIGDAANRTVLDAFEAALARVPAGRRGAATFGADADAGLRVAASSDRGASVGWRLGGGGARAFEGPMPPTHRFRIEHAQVLHPADLPRFAELGVIPSMQAQHQTSDMPWAADRLGPERVRGAYAWRALLDTGVVIAGGSDAPVERVDPIAAYAAAVTRRDEHGDPPDGWYAEQRMSRAEALAHMTRWAAYASFDEQRMGSIAAGRLADLVVLDRDLTTVPESELREARVDLTVFDGRIVYERVP